jgi:hypothetical protein
MPQTSDKQEILIQHNWMFVIIPVQAEYEIVTGNAFPATIPDTYPQMCAYCKACDAYFVRKLPLAHDFEGSGGKVGLPKWGCVDPMAGF